MAMASTVHSHLPRHLHHAMSTFRHRHLLRHPRPRRHLRCHVRSQREIGWSADLRRLVRALLRSAPAAPRSDPPRTPLSVCQHWMHADGTRTLTRHRVLSKPHDVHNALHRVLSKPHDVHNVLVDVYLNHMMSTTRFTEFYLNHMMSTTCLSTSQSSI
jgi:hypothetical protein